MTEQIYVSPDGNREVWYTGMAPATHVPLEAWLLAHPEPAPVLPDEPVRFISSDNVTIAEAEALYEAAMAATPGTTGTGTTGTGTTGTGTAGVAEAFILGKLGL